jgi:hypothetical protein
MLNFNDAVKNIAELHSIFKSHGVKGWIQDGTLLGYIRDNGFIPHDNDIDFGMRWLDFSKELYNDMTKNGFEFKTCHGRLNESLIVNFRKRNIPIDIYFYYNDGDRFYHCAAYGKARKFRVDFSYNEFDVKEINYFGHKVYVPKDEIYFLKTKYGLDWRESKPNWDSNENPLNKKLTTIITTKAESRDIFKGWINGK